MARSTLRTFIGIVAILAAATPASRIALAQYMYLDTNGDGLNSAADVVSPTGVTTIDVWLRTNADRSGTPALCNHFSTPPMSISAYQVVLHPDGGTVLWGSGVNRMPFEIEIGTGTHGNDLITGFGTSGAPLPPGLYRLATLTLTPESGTPSIQIVPSAGDHPLITAFASECFGVYLDSTMRLGLDWHDVDGVRWGGVPLAAAVDLDPKVINLKSHAPWLTAYIELSGFDLTSIDISTLRLAGSVTAAPKFAVVGDHNGNGIPDLMVKFSRSALDPLLVLGAGSLEVTGSLVTGESFAGTGEVRVIDPGGGHKAASVAPNPFNPSGMLSFNTVRPGRVRVTMFDLQGRLVRTLVEEPLMPAGKHEVRIEGRGERGEVLPSGVYFYCVNSPDGSVTGRFAILK